MNRSDTASRSRILAGFTLAELVISVTVSGLVLVSLGSALTMATRSLRPDAGAAVTLDAARCLRQIQDDLRFSSRILSRTSRTVQVMTTDNDRSGAPDLIEYSWSGTEGDPLYRRINGGSSVRFLDQVADFHLNFFTDGVTQAVPSVADSDNTILLSAFTTTSGITWHSVGYDDAYGQLIDPQSFTSTAVMSEGEEWKITRIEYYAARAFYDNAEYRVDIDLASADGLPSQENLYRAYLDPISASSSGGWLSLDVPSCPWLNSSQMVSLNLTYTDDTNRLLIATSDSTGAKGLQETDESSSEWLRPAATRGLLYRVYGQKRTRPHTDTQLPADHLVSVGLRLATPALKETPLHAGAELLNRPRNMKTAAATDFSVYMATSDSNGDGAADWAESSTSTTNSSTVSAGKWTASNKALQLAKAIPSASVVDATIVCRDTSSTSGGVECRIVVPQSTSTSSVSVRAVLERQSDGTQSLTVSEEISTSSFRTLTTLRNLSSSPQRLRLVVEPSSRTLAVWSDAVFLASLPLTSVTSPSLTATVQVHASGSTGEVDSLEVLLRDTSSQTEVEAL